MRPSILLATAAALAAMPALAQVRAPSEPGVDAPLITLTVTQQLRSAPDRASITAGVTTQHATAVGAIRDNAERIAAIVATLKRNGIADRDIQTSGFNLSPRYDHTPQQRDLPPILIGYQASNQLTVTTAETTRVGALIDALVSAGGNNISGPNFSVANPQPLLDEARQLAMQSAAARAQLYATAAGFARARLISVSEGGGFATLTMGMSSRSDSFAAAGNAIQPGEVSNAITLTVQYRLER